MMTRFSDPSGAFWMSSSSRLASRKWPRWFVPARPRTALQHPQTGRSPADSGIPLPLPCSGRTRASKQPVSSCDSMPI